MSGLDRVFDRGDHTGKGKYRYLMWLLVGFVFFSDFGSHVALAQTSVKDNYQDIRFKSLTINNGLSQNFVSSIHQDHLGFIWIGTKDGLNMYDGYRFTIYKHNPFNAQSVSDNFIKAIYCDSKGRLWIGTLNGGLNLLDRKTGKFIRFIHDPEDDHSISNNNVQAIIEDGNGNIWIGTSGGGINKLSFTGEGQYPEKTTITRITGKVSGFEMEKSEVLSLVIDRYNNLWIGTSQCVISADLSKSEPVFQHIPFEVLQYPLESGETKEEIMAGGRVIFEDQAGELWMGNLLGLFRLDRQNHKFIQFLLKDRNFPLQKVIAATSFFNKDLQEIWLSSEEMLIIINPETAEHTCLIHHKNRPDGLQKGRIISLFADHGGTLWTGSNGYGISLFDPYATKFKYPDEYFMNEAGTLFSTRDMSIRAFHETLGENNFLWIGTNEGLFRASRTTSSLKPALVTDPGFEGIIIVFSIQSDDTDLLWLGTNWGLVRFNQFDNSYKIYKTNLVDEDQNREPRVSKVFIYGDDIGIITPHTISFFNRRDEAFEHYYYNSGPFNEHREPVYPSVLVLKNGDLRVGTKNGLLFFAAETKKMTRYLNDPADTNSLNFNDVRAILPDPYEPERYLWLATGGGGLSRFDVATSYFKNFTELDGLSNNMVYGLLYDGAGNFWASTNHGLSKFNLSSEKFTNYSVSDGLQSNEFNGGAFYKNQRGEMFFGGINGYNSFFPEMVKDKQYHAPVVITGFELLTDRSDVNGEEKFINTSEATQLNLKHNQNHFLIEFASLDFAAPDRNRFSYSLKTQGEQWINIGTNHSITFTNMKPGSYTLKVRGTNNDGVWSNHAAVLQINILPPWWLRIPAFVIYILLASVLFLGLRQYELSRIRLRERIKKADFEADKLKELDVMKSQFFANISHEFRTPLTLIKGPLEDMMEEYPDQTKQKIFSVMHSNTERLLRLINQLLDISKLETGEFKIKVSTGNIVGTIKGLVMSFTSIVEQKKINLRFIEASSLKNQEILTNFYYDKDVIEKIINNLISNAIKFTPSKGRITVTACIRQWKNGREMFEVTVKDTGIGIPADKLPFIYDRFYQVDASSKREQEGSGIGLAYVKELMKAHKGEIAVMSKPGEGTVFRLRFPLGSTHFSADQIVTMQEQEAHAGYINYKGIEEHSLEKSNQEQHKKNRDLDMILVVEDHADVRHYICSRLQKDYLILEAPSAAAGLTIAEESIPDLIISDVMMPGMDGFEFCAKIKSNEKTSHIPVILLTARADEQDKIHGLETGADDYLTKPFNAKELLVRVRNLIDNRKYLREKFEVTSVIKPGEISVTSRDRSFMEKLIQVIEKNMKTENFSVEELARGAGMSQSQLHRKLKALINQSAVQFIRSVRMNRAKELLEKDAGNIAEIAYMVGFSDPGYFTKTYKSFFGILPSEVKKNVKP
jgi:signal transduction histidine kinase/DNA-binding response OmpR family regulator/ligand-binding sensor domain-containing protein